MKSKKAIIVGAGGHSRVLLSILNYDNDIDVVAIADRDQTCFGEVINGVNIKYSWDELDIAKNEGIDYAYIAIGDNEERAMLFKKLKLLKFKIPNVIHPTVILERDVIMKDGNHLCMGAKVATSVKIGSNCIVYSGSIIDHETTIMDNVYIAPGCLIAGRVTIENDVFIGIGAIIKENVVIGEGSIVGAGAVVLENVQKNSVVAGIPAKLLK